MVVQKPCDNPGCHQGKVTLFTSVKICEKCNGTGFIRQTIQEYQAEEDIGTKFYKNSVDYENGYDHEF